MKRYYVHEFCLDDPILIDTKEKTWTFYKTNIYGQIYNLDEKPKKVTRQRINGLIRRLNNGKYNSMDGYVVDQYIYNYIMDDKQRSKCNRSIELETELIASGDDLKEVLEITCKYFLEKSKRKTDNPDYYKDYLKSI